MRILYFAYETHLVLRRNKVFLPMLALMLLLQASAVLTGWLSLDNFREVLFDFTLAGLHVAGGGAAIFWGVKMMADARQEGSIEVALASPASRAELVIGKF